MTADQSTRQPEPDRHEHRPAAPRGAATVPMAAKWLGRSGAIPFVGLAVAAYLVDAPLAAVLTFALLVYGAVILSFLGGIQWGLAISRPTPAANQSADTASLATSIAPSLIGWAAVLLGGPAGLVLLAAAFAVVLRQDLRLSARGDAPAWFPKLRWPLSVVVIAALVAAALR